MTTFNLDREPDNWLANLALLIVLVLIAVGIEYC